MRHCGPSRLEVEMSHVGNRLRNSQTRNGAQAPSHRVDRKRVIASSIVCAALVLVVLVIVVGTGSKKPPEKTAAPLRPEMVLKTYQSPKLGTYLVNDKGFTLYTYQLDMNDHSYCVNYCLHMWPALTVASGRRPIGVGVNDLGAITRSNGVRQVTYEGHPLYTFEIDIFPGQTLGNHGPWNIVRISKATN
jgi:predicted lipoprotein with Yx(FWY)xxD motif